MCDLWRPRRPRYRRFSPKAKRVAVLCLILFVLLAVCLHFALKVMDLITDLTVNYASDLVQAKVNSTVQQVMEQTSGGEYYNYQTDANGKIVALSVDVDRVSTVSTRILQAAMATDDESNFLELEVPLESLLGINFAHLDIPLPVRVMMLTTSYVDYHNELVSAAINQSKYQLYLHISVDIDVLVPWQRSTAKVESDVLLAETVIVGDVPGTYIEVE